MSQQRKGILLWIFAAIFTLVIAVYQRTTGPTYPVKGKIELNQKNIHYKLIRSADSDGPARISLSDIPKDVHVILKYRKYKTNEPLTEVNFKWSDDELIAEMPPQPPAGKLAYTVYVSDGSGTKSLTEEPVVLRFKGPVPLYILAPHILFMFLAMLFSSRTGIEAIVKGSHIKAYSFYTLVFLFIGGLILGPLVQQFAFGELWTGWPFGGDLTDNKTIFAFLGWLIAWLIIRRNPKKGTYAIIAAIILLAVYLIPHSMFGSELDYKKGTIETGKQ